MRKEVKFLILIIATILILITLFLINKNKEQSQDKTQEITIINNISEFNIKNRVSIIKDGVIYIGNNKKELENGFYDIKIVSSDNLVDIHLNKLWYTKYGQDYIEDNYLASICRELVNRLNMDLDKENFEYMIYKYIKENYVSVRNGEQIESLNMYKITISLQIKEGIPLLSLKGE